MVTSMLLTAIICFAFTVLIAKIGKNDMPYTGKVIMGSLLVIELAVMFVTLVIKAWS